MIESLDDLRAQLADILDTAQDLTRTYRAQPLTPAELPVELGNLAELIADLTRACLAIVENTGGSPAPG